MLAVDTNVVVRFLTGDDPHQYALVSKLVANEQLWIPTTVLLETGWVLRKVKNFNQERVVDSLESFLGLPNVFAENAEVAAQALKLARKGMDFADAFHFASSIECEEMISFDADFIKISKREGGLKVRLPHA